MGFQHIYLCRVLSLIPGHKTEIFIDFIDNVTSQKINKHIICL